MALCVKLNEASFTRVGLIKFTPCTTTPLPGEFVFVVAILGTDDCPNRPPASVVGISSIVKRPHNWNFSLKTWSMRPISCRALKMFFTGANKEVVAAVVFPFKSGSLLKISLIYAAALGLIRFVGNLGYRRSAGRANDCPGANLRDADRLDHVPGQHARGRHVRSLD